MAEYTETFAGFILECKQAYEDLCARIEAGDVPSGGTATVRITLNAQAVNRIRADRLLLAAASENGHG